MSMSALLTILTLTILALGWVSGSPHTLWLAAMTAALAWIAKSNTPDTKHCECSKIKCDRLTLIAKKQRCHKTMEW